MTTANATSVTHYQIDAAHSEATFTVRHLITKVRGRFSEFAGTIAFDAAAPANSTVAFTIQAASIDTNQKDRDAHLRSPDFFETETYPTITFTSTGITAQGGDAYHVTGQFTIRDVTREITLPVTLAVGPKWMESPKKFRSPAMVVSRVNVCAVTRADPATGASRLTVAPARRRLPATIAGARSWIDWPKAVMSPPTGALTETEEPAAYRLPVMAPSAPTL